MRSLSVKNFNLKATLESGQIFRWEKINEWHYITTASTIVKIKQVNRKLVYDSNNRVDILNFFDLRNNNYSSVVKKISSDEKLAAAVKKYHGLRIIKQEPWECAASFICSSFSNIKRIQQNLNAIARSYGKKISYGEYSTYSFPTTTAIARNPKKLKSCGLGYRAKYLAATATMVSNGFELGKLRGDSYENAKTQLMQLPGVGEKVADCILLFSLGFKEAFPVDVWMEKIMNASSKKLSAKKLAAAGRAKYGKNAGYAQQFLYHYARNEKI